MPMSYSLTSLSSVSKLSGSGSALKSFYAERLAEVEDPLAAVVVLGETLDAVGDGRDLIFVAKPQECLRLLWPARQRGMFLEEFHEVKAQLVRSLEGPFRIELAEAIALHPHGEPAEVPFRSLRLQEARQRRQTDGSRPDLKEITTADAIGRRYVHSGQLLIKEDDR